MKFKLFWILLAALFLSGCSIFGQATPQPLPTVVLDSNPSTPPAPVQGLGSGVIASGVVVPARQAQMVFSLSERVKTVTVAAGDQVTAGQVLVSLEGSEKYIAAIAAANMELLAAQQALTSLNDNADQARAQAQQNLANAAKALSDAQDERYRKNLARVSQATLDQVQADLIIAKDVLKKAQENYDDFANRAENDLMRAQAFSRLAAAQQKVDQIQWNLDWLLSRPNTLEVDQADAAIALAQANLAEAQRQYDRLQNGPDPDALALARARMANAQAQLASNQSALANLELKAPFAGTVIKVITHSGEWIIPGQPILVLADLDHLRIETTDLSERDIPQIKEDQPVSVLIKALNQNVKGHVSYISPLADTLGGDVVYKTTIDLDAPPAGLRAGMSVEVAFGVTQ
jgi:multidrug efflux pump subunit AcrA (membrane-fusion protein)